MKTSSEGNERKEIAALSTRGWVSLRQFCVLADISYPTAQKLVREGKLNATPVGGIIRIYAEEVRRFLHEGNAVNNQAGAGEKSPALSS